MPVPTGVATLRGTLPWIAPEIIKTPGAVTEAVVSKPTVTQHTPKHLAAVPWLVRPLFATGCSLLPPSLHLHPGVADVRLLRRCLVFAGCVQLWCSAVGAVDAA
jgi:hypothetical protein